MGTVSDTLIERVDELVHQPSDEPPLWGSPLVSTTPISISVRDLGARIAALEEAVRQIAVEVQKLVDNA